jgi:hypothetical protein
MTTILAAIGAFVILYQLARLAWALFHEAAWQLHLYRRGRYSAVVADRLRRYC